MIRKSWSLILFVALATTAAAFPQEENGPFVLDVSGGFTLPIGDNMDPFERGFAFEGALGYRMTTRLDLGVLYGYDGFGYPDDVEAAASAAGVDIDFSQQRLGGYLRAFFSEGRKRFYTRIALTRCSVSQTIPVRTPGGDVVGTADFDDDYLCAGGGLGLQLRGDDDANLNLELMHHTIFTDDGDGHFLTLTLGGSFGFLL